MAKNNKKNLANTKKGQRNIKDALIAKKKSPIKFKPVCVVRPNALPYLNIVNDIMDAHSHYEISTLARVYFREHSNINEILDLYLEKQGKDHEDKAKFLGPIIRLVMSMKKNIAVYPLHLFKFNSSYHECQAKMLLTYPNIATEEDLDDVNRYFLGNSIKQCSVSLDLDNQLRTHELEYLEEKERKYGVEKHGSYLRNSTYYALRQYYEENHLVQNLYIDDITVEKLHEISNFEKIVQNVLKDHNIGDALYDKIASRMLQEMKDNREVYLDQEKLRIYPKYNLITNNLTREQEIIVTRNYDAFYAYTNGSILSWRYKSSFPVNKELSTSERRKERQNKFWFKYIRQKNKKLPPFHNLHWISSESISSSTERQSSESSKQQQPGSSDIWAKKNTTERNDYAIELAIVAPQTNMEKDVKTLAYYLSCGPPPSEMNGLLKILLQQKHLVSALKHELLQCSDYDEELFLKQKSLIYINYIISHLKEKDKEFLFLLTECPHDIKEQIAEPLKFFDIGLSDIDSEFSPQITSTQSMDIPDEALRSDSIDPDDIEIMPLPKMNQLEFIPPEQIKKEKLSMSLTENNSDVLILSHNPEEVIVLSDNEQPRFVRVLENDAKDKYQQILNLDTQNDQEAEVLRELEQEYALKITKGLRSKATTKKSKATRSRPQNAKLTYLNDDDSQNSNGNQNISTGINIQHEHINFSVFLSSQLNYIYVSHLKTPTSLTFVKYWARSSCTHRSSFHRSCFYFETQRVAFRKDHDLEVTINIPQLSLYDVSLRHIESIRGVLNLKEHNWQILYRNLNQLEHYLFTKKHERVKKDKEFEFLVKKHLDLYFSSSSNFKKFELKSITNEHFLECKPIYLNASIPKNITKAIYSKVLDKMKITR